MRIWTSSAGLLALAGLLLACGNGDSASRGAAQGVDTLRLGETLCPHCGELVDELRFGGELVTREGETLQFRSTECLVGYILEQGLGSDDVKSFRVVDFNHGRRLISAESAVYVRSQHRSSPHGMGLLALPPDNPELVFNVHFAWGGEVLDWEGVRELVDREWRVTEVRAR